MSNVKAVMTKDEIIDQLAGANVFDYEVDEEDGSVEFYTDYNEDDFYGVRVGEDHIFLPNTGTCGGFEKEIEDINDIDLGEELEGAGNEEYGWECV